MARYRGTVQGSRGQASRLGHSHLTATADGWDIGGRVEVGISNESDAADVVRLYVTAGSHRSKHEIFLGAFRRDKVTGEYQLLAPARTDTMRSQPVVRFQSWAESWAKGRATDGGAATASLDNGAEKV